MSQWLLMHWSAPLLARLRTAAAGLAILMLAAWFSGLSVGGAQEVRGRVDGSQVASERNLCGGTVASASALLRSRITQVRDLWDERMPGVDAPNVLPPDVDGTRPVERARAWLSNGGSRDDAILVLGREGRAHCAYLINSRGIAAFGSVNVSEHALNLALEQWRQLVGIASPVRGAREATRRGRAAAPPLVEANASSRSILEFLARSLMPGSVRAEVLRYTHVYIVPYGALGGVPYAVLPSGIGATQFVDQVSISVAPSAEALLGRDVSRATHALFPGGCVQGQPRGRLGLVIGNPTIVRDEEWVFSDLPGAELEARRVARMLGVSPLLGADATTGNIGANVASARWLHIAAHGVANRNDPLLGFIALADGRWTAREIQESCIPAELVVLSACQTGLGGRHVGGIIGLARAFEHAGAQEVVVSLWSVDDAATERLMRDFWLRYRNRDSAETTSDVLRSAMIDLRRDYPHPRHWAPFVVFGAPAR